MSGFEVIGVVLGVWPVVVNALTLYKATKDGRGYGLLLNELKTEEVVYREFVKLLLQADVPEADLVQLTDRKRSNVGLWKDRGLHFSLERRIGHEKSKLVLATLVEMDKLLVSLSEKLGGSEDKGKIRTSIRQMKHNLPTSTFRQELESLKQLNGRLQRLVTNCTSSGFPAQGKQPNSPPRLSPNILKENTAHAKDLYYAICNSYNCQCPYPHEANIGLRQVSPKLLGDGESFELIFPVDEEKEDMIEVDLKSPISPSYSSITSTEMAYTEESYDTFSLGDSHRCWSPRNSVTGMPQSPCMDHKGRSSPPRDKRGRSVSFSRSDNGKENVRRIDDLCIFVKKLDDLPPLSTQTSCLGILGVKEKEYTVKITSVGVDSSSDRSVVCLDDYLVSYKSWELNRQKRMDLALSLSLAILHFYSTPWINRWWTWKDFCMLKDDNKQVFVTGKFYSSQKPSSPTAKKLSHPASASLFWSCFGEPILTRLGFALIELALGKRLSQMRPAGVDPNADQDMLDTYTAKSLLENGSVFQEAGQLYHDAVQACLSHQVTMPSGPRSLNSEHPNFQEDLERFVVGPIRDFHMATWGQIFHEDDGDDGDNSL